MTTRVLHVFIKNPVLGQVKTRLAATIGPVQALAIYRELLRHTREQTQQVEAERWLWYSEAIPESDEWPSADFHKQLQEGEDLGARMAQAFAAGSDFSAQVIIGSDCPQLQAAHLNQAFALLEVHPFVLGPAKDGGYYLLGLRQPTPALFSDMRWSTPTVAAETLHRIEQMGGGHALLPTLSDVDTLADWQAYGWPLPKD